MVDEIHYNRAFHTNDPEPGKQYRQIVILEGSVNYEILVFEGRVLRTEAELRTRKGSIQVRTAPTIGTARIAAQEVADRSLTQGWVIHHH
jgi:hypothetical protein